MGQTDKQFKAYQKQLQRNIESKKEKILTYELPQEPKEAIIKALDELLQDIQFTLED